MVELAVKHDGTAEKPYEINSAEDLKQLAEDVNTGNDFEGKFFELTADIELSGNWTPIGYRNFRNGDKKPFKGTFDGQDHTISNLIIDNPSGDCLGLFGYVCDGGTIKNINLSNVNISGNEDVGGLVGLNWGTVENCTVSGATVSGDWKIGGLVGDNKRGTVENCTVNNATVSGDEDSDDEDIGKNSVGGLVGSNGRKVENCTVSDTTVSGDWKIGGLVGDNYGTVENCTVNNATVSGNYRVGGLVGDNWSTVENCTVSNATISGKEDVGGFVGSNSSNNIDGVINGTNYYHGNQPEAVGRKKGKIAGTVTRVYSIKFPEGVTVDGAIEIGGKTFFTGGATLTVSNFTGGEIVFDDDLTSSVMPKLQFTS